MIVGVRAEAERASVSKGLAHDLGRDMQIGLDHRVPAGHLPPQSVVVGWCVTQAPEGIFHTQAGNADQHHAGGDFPRWRAARDEQTSIAVGCSVRRQWREMRHS